jgi:hypothetical protein
LTDRIQGTRKEVRKFGFLFGVIGGLLAAYLGYRQNPLWPWFLGGGVLFAALGLIAWKLLKPVYILWMKFAYILAWVNTRIILTLFFFLVITPVGVLMRLFGRDFLNERIAKSAKTYWIPREPSPTDKSRYERLF